MKYLLISCVLWLACSADAIDVSSMTEKQIKDHAHELFTQEKYQEAIDFCNLVLAHNPKSPEAYYTKGRIFLRLDKDVEALKLFDKALENGISPSGDTHYYRGITLDALGRDQEATQEYLVSARNKLSSSNLEFIAWIYTMSGKYNEAIEFCHTVLRHDPKNGEAHFRLGIVYRKLQQLEESVTYFKEAIKLNRVYVAEVYYHLGLSLEFQEKFVEALDAYQTAIERGYDHRDVYQREASLQFKLGIQPGVQSP